jgi:desulfoferrodoxin-like iron-binding protein
MYFNFVSSVYNERKYDQRLWRAKPNTFFSSSPFKTNRCGGRSITMTKVKNPGEIYKCEICGNVVEVKVAGGGELICCGEPMKLEE